MSFLIKALRTLKVKETIIYIHVAPIDIEPCSSISFPFKAPFHPSNSDSCNYQFKVEQGLFHSVLFSPIKKP